MLCHIIMKSAHNFFMNLIPLFVTKKPRLLLFLTRLRVSKKSTMQSAFYCPIFEQNNVVAYASNAWNFQHPDLTYNDDVWWNHIVLKTLKKSHFTIFLIEVSFLIFTICKTFFALFRTLSTLFNSFVLVLNLLYKTIFKGLERFIKGKKGLQQSKN